MLSQDLARILHGLAERDRQDRGEGRGTEFVLMPLPGGRVGMKPGIPGNLAITQADVLDLADAGYVRELPANSAGVLIKFALTAAGRAAGSPPVATQILPPEAPAGPGPDDVLAWLVKIENSAQANTLREGSLLANQALAEFGPSSLPAFARRLIELTHDGLITFDTRGLAMDQVSDVDRVAIGGDFRSTPAGRDRVARPASEQARPNVTQIIHATEAQVAAGDINNYATFSALLNDVDDALEQVSVDETTRDEARSIVERLRAGSGTVASGTVAGGGAVLLGAVLKQVLGLP